jgi:hypothetical protein
VRFSRFFVIETRKTRSDISLRGACKLIGKIPKHLMLCMAGAHADLPIAPSITIFAALRAGA